MSKTIKFVATLLVGSSLAIPGSAVGACLLQSLATRHCGPHCPMMMDTQSGSQITEQPNSADGSCCQASTARPVTGNSTFTNQNRAWTRLHRLESAAMAINPPAVDETAFPATASLPSTSSQQAFLCTFLI